MRAAPVGGHVLLWCWRAAAQPIAAVALGDDVGPGAPPPGVLSARTGARAVCCGPQCSLPVPVNDLRVWVASGLSAGY